MRHQAFSPRDVDWEADVVVVGSGAGGSSAAVQLARGGLDVVLVEAGPWRDPEQYPSTIFGSFRDNFDHWGATVTRGPALWPVIQGKGVGGTTVINSAIVVRTPEDIFAAWSKDHGAPEDLAQRVWTHQDRIEEELFVEPTAFEYLGRSSELALEAGKRMGIDSHRMRRSVRGCEGKSACIQGCRSRKKQSTNLQWIPEVIERGGGVLSCAPVHRVTMDGDRAVGVQGRFMHPQTRKKGGRFTVRARLAVVMAASSTHTPCILQRSGLRHGALGAQFRAHPGCAVPGVYADPVGMEFGATQGWASTEFRQSPGYKLETLNLPLELAAARLKGGGRALMERIEELPRMGVWVAACRADSAGTVRNGFGGRPTVRYTMDRRDMSKLRDGLKKTAELHFSMGATHVMPGIQGMPYKLKPDQLAMFDDATLDTKAYTCILSHLFGGAVMGDTTHGVCDAMGRVHGVSGLYVADAALLPTNLGVNPQHTIMAMAAVVADGILEQNR